MKLSIYLLVLLSLMSCSLGKFRPQSIEQTKTATGYPMKQYGKQLYIGGQPKAVDFIKLRQEGFVAVVNLRNHKEDGKYNEKWERNNSLLSGMSYYHVGFDPKTDKLTKDFVNKIKAPIEEESQRGKVLIHCRTGNRAAMWVAADAYLNEKATKEDAKKLATELGAKKGPYQRLEEFINH